MEKTRFAQNDAPMISNARAEARREKIRADEAVRALRRMQRRLQNFYAEVEYVTFDEQTAPVWAPDWYAWLATGLHTAPAGVEAEDGEAPAPTEVPEDDELPEWVEDEPAA